MRAALSIVSTGFSSTTLLSLVVQLQLCRRFPLTGRRVALLASGDLKMSRNSNRAQSAIEFHLDLLAGTASLKPRQRSGPRRGGLLGVMLCTCSCWLSQAATALVL